jgi:hypothetical protein
MLVFTQDFNFDVYCSCAFEAHVVWPEILARLIYRLKTTISDKMHWTG